MNEFNPAKRPAQANGIPAQRGDTPNEKEHQRNLDEIGSDEDTEVEPVESDDKEEAARTDER